MQSFLLVLVSIVVFIVGEVSAQTLSPTPPPGGNLEAWREAWLAYKRELRTWCTTNYPDMLDICLQTEMAKQGVSPAFFADLRRSSTQPASPRSVTVPPAPSMPQASSTQPTKEKAKVPRAFPMAIPQWLTVEEQLYRQMAELVATIAHGRDEGVQLTSTLAVLRKNWASMQRPQAEIRALESAFAEISIGLYANPYVTARQAQGVFEAGCVRKSRSMQGSWR